MKSRTIMYYTHEGTGTQFLHSPGFNEVGTLVPADDPTEKSAQDQKAPS